MAHLDGHDLICEALGELAGAGLGVIIVERNCIVLLTVANALNWSHDSSRASTKRLDNLHVVGVSATTPMQASSGASRKHKKKM